MKKHRKGNTPVSPKHQKLLGRHGEETRKRNNKKICRFEAP